MHLLQMFYLKMNNIAIYIIYNETFFCEKAIKKYSNLNTLYNFKIYFYIIKKI